MAVKSDCEAGTGASTPKPVFSGNVSDESAVEHILSIRADERMRIADELHDTACQLLALLQLNLGRMRRQRFGDVEATITECEELVSRIGRHMRDATTAAGSPVPSHKR